MNLNHPPSATWRQLEDFITEDKTYAPSFWTRLNRRPLTSGAIETLARRGFVVSLEKMENYGEFIKRRGRRTKILLRKGMSGYDRDETLLHELTHFLHYPLLNDREDVEQGRRTRNCARVEWIARRARADPQVLFAAVTLSGLEPLIYDKTSYQAFHHLYKTPLRKKDFTYTRME